MQLDGARRHFFKVLLLLLFGCFAVYSERSASDVSLVFCDVGQGDATLISSGATQLLVDTGPRGSAVLGCLAQQLPFWDKTLEMVVLTHPDLDHIGGFLELSTQYKILSVLYVPLEPDSQAATRVLQRLEGLAQEGTQVIPATQGFSFSLGVDLAGTVFNPFLPFSLEEACKKSIAETQLWDKSGCYFAKKSTAQKSKNNLSIGIKMVLDGVSIYLMGDMEKEAELALIASGSLHKANLLKAGHHGSKSSTSKDFIEVIRPEISVISAGAHNTYNHPSPQVLQQLEEIGSKVYRTDESGTIVFYLREGMIFAKNQQKEKFSWW